METTEVRTKYRFSQMQGKKWDAGRKRKKGKILILGHIWVGIFYFKMTREFLYSRSSKKYGK